MPLRTCLILERERAKEPPGIREQQTRQKRIKKSGKKKKGGVEGGTSEKVLQNCFELETDQWRWNDVCDREREQ